jgi:formylglycine-generating enzyme required for sulfatase activity
VSLNELQRYVGGKTRAYVARRFNESQRPFSRNEVETEALDFALLPFKADGGGAVPIVPPSSLGGNSVTPPKPTGPPPPSTVAPFDAAIAKQHQEAWARYLGAAPESANSIGMKLMVIPPGEYTMGGGAPNENADFRPKVGGAAGYRVRITKPFFIGKCEVTQAEWQAVMQTTPWRGEANVREEPTQPATHVTWQDATEFCRTLSAKEGKTYRLPSEAEWEYACRAGTTTKHWFTDADTQGRQREWFDATYAHPVGQKLANSWRLHDMLGNVSEWCRDGYQEQPFRSPGDVDPVGPHRDQTRVQRGGNWALELAGCADRDFDEVDGKSEYLGFRVVREP